MADTVTIYSTLTGKPFEVVLENYPFYELPKLSDEDIKALAAKGVSNLSDLEITLLLWEQGRARRKVKFFKKKK